MKQLSVKDFILKYNLKYTPQAIGYHARTGKIDFVKPARDILVVLSTKTLEFYKLT